MSHGRTAGAGPAVKGPDLDIVPCISFARDVPSPEHDLVRAFRAGDADAAAVVLRLARATLEAAGPRLLGRRTLAVAVPGHRAGSTNRACEALIAALAAQIPGIVPAPGVLVRLEDSPEGKLGLPRNPDQEARTLAWRDDVVPTAINRVLLVDDVVRTSGTLHAAVRAIPAPLASRASALVIFEARTRR